MDWATRGGVDLDHPNAKWVVVGWGAHDFYTQTGTYSDLRSKAVWRAITGDAAVLRVSLTGAFLPNAQVQYLELSVQQYDALLDTIKATLPYGANTSPLTNINGFSQDDRFFPAKGNFHIFNTCNVWIGRSLRTAGVRFGRWTPMTFSIRLSHWLWQ